MKKYIDLHMHTNYSDGVCTPNELLDIVRSKNLAVFSVTDHDTYEGFQAVKSLLDERDPELISGVELSVSLNEGDLHMLAYGFDTSNAEFTNALAEFQQRRTDRGREIVEKLNGMGVHISYEDVEQQAQGTVIGRPHIAQAMHQQNHVKTYEEAFERYIRTGGPAYVPKVNFAPGDAIDLIHGARGLAFLAHPAIDENDKYIETLVGMGLDGIEVYHPAHTRSVTDRFKHLAERFRLLTSGGSDFHGREGRYSAIGSQKVPYTCLDQLKERLEKVRTN
jgi:hypothetical protein